MAYQQEVKETAKFSSLFVLVAIILVVGIGGFALFGERFTNPFQEDTHTALQHIRQVSCQERSLTIDRGIVAHSAAESAAERNAVLFIVQFEIDRTSTPTTCQLEDWQISYMQNAGVYLY